LWRYSNRKLLWLQKAFTKKPGNPTFFEKIPPNLPLPKGGAIPLFAKEGRGEIVW
jgi:hypothetical protein